MSQAIKDKQQNQATAAGKRRRKQVTFFPGVLVRDFTPRGNKNDRYYSNNDYSAFLSSNRKIVCMMQAYGTLSESIVETTFSESTRGLERCSDGGRRSTIRKASIQAVLWKQKQTTESTGYHQDCDATEASIALVYHQACQQSKKIARNFGLQDEHDVLADDGMAAAVSSSDDDADGSSAGDFNFALPPSVTERTTAKRILPIVCGAIADDNSVSLHHNRRQKRWSRRLFVTAAE